MMTKSIRASLLGVALGVTGLLAAPIGPDAGGYTANDGTAFSFVNIAPTGIRALAGTDDATSVAPVGFPFTFYGQAYTSACVSTNGFLTLGGCADAFANQDLSATPTPGGLPIIAAFWSDLTFLEANADAVYYETIGTAPSRQFIVQWNSAFPQNAQQPVTVQAILYEGSNQIRFQYDSVDTGAGDPASNGGAATVGICTPDGRTDGRCLQWSYNVPVLYGDMAILFTPPAATTARVDGELKGNGFIDVGGRRHAFDFAAFQRRTGEQKGGLSLRVIDVPSTKRPQDRFKAEIVSTLALTDDPAFVPFPNGADHIDSVVLTGVGEWNGAPGYRYELAAADRGEPGVHNDTFRIRIWDPAGALVLDAGNPLDGGNVQVVRSRKR